MEEATGQFFPEGRNNLGPVTSFGLDLRIYQEVDDEITVGQLYTETKLSPLGTYLTTQGKKTVTVFHFFQCSYNPAICYI